MKTKVTWKTCIHPDPRKIRVRHLHFSDGETALPLFPERGQKNPDERAERLMKQFLKSRKVKVAEWRADRYAVIVEADSAPAAMGHESDAPVEMHEAEVDLDWGD